MFCLERTGAGCEITFVHTAAAAVAAIAIIELALFAVSAWRHRAAPVRLAVLPVENLSGQPAYDYLAAGLTQELMALLACSPVFNVAGTSTDRITEKLAPTDIAHQYGVRYVCSGSFRPAGSLPTNSWSNTAKLADSETGTAIWSDHCVRDATYLEALPEEINRAVAASLSVTLF